MTSEMWPDRWLLDLFGIELPIVAAPMANFAGVDLAIASQRLAASGLCLALR
jgi:NAD(P)H-dependent flavin oxidoreductase YrpB (nitropropane dioxygenase family)